MKLECLTVFHEVARCGSISVAAKNLHLTQQAVSASMRRLEEELETAMFIRRQRGIALNARGRELLAFVEEFLPAWRKLEKNFRSDNSPNLCGKLMVYVNNSFYLERLVHIVQRFCACHPAVKVSTSALNLDEIRARLTGPDEAGVHSIGLINLPCEPGGGISEEFCGDDGLLFRILAKARYHACMGIGHPLAKRRRISIKRLLKEPLIVATANDLHFAPLYRLLERHGKPNVVLATSSLNVWQHSIANNLGIGFLHAIFLDGAEPFGNCLKNLATMPIIEDMSAVTGYLVRENTDEVIETFLRVLTKK